jgi:hypothetical protein
MAHLHFRRDIYKSGGSSATTRLEYITRQSAEELTASERQLRYIEREGREDLVTTESRNLPVWAQDNPHTYFQAAERHEGKGWVAFEEYKITLPHEFNHEHNQALTEDLVATLGHGRLPLTYAFHDPQTLRGTRQQPHLHLLLSRRQTDEHARTPEQHFRKYNRAQPDRGGAEKDPFFAERRHLWHQRVLVSDVINVHLERAGLEARVHPGRLDDRGLGRQPEPKLLPSESREYREHGIVSETMQAVLDIRAKRAAQWEREQQNAQHYWEVRKVELSMERDMPQAQCLERIALAREQTISRPTLAQLREEERALEQAISQQQTGVHRLHAEVMIATHRERQQSRTVSQERSPRSRGRLATPEEPAQGLHGPRLDRTRERERDGYTW